MAGFLPMITCDGCLATCMTEWVGTMTPESSTKSVKRSMKDWFAQAFYEPATQSNDRIKSAMEHTCIRPQCPQSFTLEVAFGFHQG